MYASLSEYTSLSTRSESPSPQSQPQSAKLPGELSSLSIDGRNNGEKYGKYWKSISATCLIVTLFLIILVSVLTQNSDSHAASGSTNKASNYAISTSATDYDYISNKLLSYLSGLSQDSYISDECEFVGVSNNNDNDNDNDKDNNDEMAFDSENFESILKALLLNEGSNNEESSVIRYEMTTISKPKYTVEWIFGTKTLNNENEHFTIVLQIDPENDYEIFEMYFFSSKFSDESAEALYRRLFTAFDFNKNGVLCITEFPSMMGAISGLGNIEMSNELLSYMDNKDNHIKFTQDEFVSILLSDNIGKSINNFGDLRFAVRSSVVDGYMAVNNNNNNNCVYYDLSWNCDSGNNDYYKTDENNSNMVATVSDSVFTSVCCNVNIVDGNAM